MPSRKRGAAFMQRRPRVHLTRYNSARLNKRTSGAYHPMTIKRPNPYAISIPIDARIDYLVIAQVNRNVPLIINDVAALN